MSDELSQKCYWYGEDVDTLSREQLIAAVKQLGAELRASYSRAISQNRTWGDIARAASARR